MLNMYNKFGVRKRQPATCLVFFSTHHTDLNISTRFNVLFILARLFPIDRLDISFLVTSIADIHESLTIREICLHAYTEWSIKIH